MEKSTKNSGRGGNGANRMGSARQSGSTSTATGQRKNLKTMHNNQ